MNSDEIMFVKLQNKLLGVDWYKFKSNQLVESFYNENRQGGSYFYKLQHFTEFLSLHDGMFSIRPSVIYYCEFTGDQLVTPHRDKSISVSLNLYLETDNADTIYYKEINHDPTHVKYKNIKPFGPPIENLVETCRFTAKPYDLYLLNVNEIHGIQKTTTNPRSMITYRWTTKFSFNQILNSLNI
jgi:hypothetical protein